LNQETFIKKWNKSCVIAQKEQRLAQTNSSMPTTTQHSPNSGMESTISLIAQASEQQVTLKK